VPLKSAYAVFSGFVNGVFQFGRELGFYVRAVNFVRKLQLFVFAGSGALSDHYGGPMNFPYSVFKWSVLAKLAGSKIAFVSVGAGPIDFTSSKLLLKCALSIADYRSFRDQDSKKMIERLGLKGTNLVFPDLVQGLKIGGSRKPDNKSVKNVVGINPFPHYWNSRDPVSYERYVEKIALFASWLLENRYRVVLFPTHLRGDSRVIDDIRRKIINDLRQEYEVDPLEISIQSISDLVNQISVLDLVVATRFHGIMLSFLLNKPVIGISNQPKMDSLMKDMGQEGYLFDLESFDVETLKQRFLVLEANGDRIKRTLKPIISGYREALKKQYEEVFKLVNKFGKVPCNDCNTNRLNFER
jgi:polysaccharide pyruvyl transferase WcaK-like protein